MVALSTICANGQSAQTEQDTIKVETLQGVVTTASATPSSVRQTVPVQSIDSKDIEKLGVQELFEAVRTFSGVSIKDYGGVGGVKTVSLRNLGAQHTAVCYDGVTLSDAQSGQIDIGRFSLDNIDQISVSIGVTDDIFQSARMFASAGALSIKSSKPLFTERPLNVTAQMRIASFGMYNPYLLYQQKIGKRWSVSANGDILTAEGTYPFKLINSSEVTTQYRKNSDVNTYRGELNLYGDLGKGGELSFKANWLSSQRGLPGSVVLYNNDATERLWDKNGFAALNYENNLSNKIAIRANLKYNYAWNRYTIKSALYESGGQDDRYTQNEYYTSVAMSYTPSERIMVVFAEDYFVNTLISTIPESQSPTRYSSLSALAARYKSNRLSATVSLIGTYITERVLVGEAANDKSRLSPSVSISYKLFKNSNWRVRASYKDAYRVPTFNDLYYSRVGNKSLAPEKTSQFNLGVTWSGVLKEDIVDFASLSLDGYLNRIKDKIVAIPTLFIWKMMNVGSVQMTGLDVNSSAVVSLPHRMSIGLNVGYSLQYALNITDPSAKVYKHQIPYTPRNSGSFSLTWTNKWINAGYIMNGVGKRYSLPQNIDSNLIEGYIDHSVSLHRTFNFKHCQMKIQGEVLNIGNHNYEVVRYYPMPGRSYRLTIKISL